MGGKPCEEDGIEVADVDPNLKGAGGDDALEGSVLQPPLECPPRCGKIAGTIGGNLLVPVGGEVPPGRPEQ